MTKKITLLLAWLLVAIGAQAQSSIDDLGEKLVNDFLTDVTTLDGRFEQSLIDAEGTIIERTSGTLEIERPTAFDGRTTSPTNNGSSRTDSISGVMTLILIR